MQKQAPDFDSDPDFPPTITDAFAQSTRSSKTRSVSDHTVRISLTQNHWRSAAGDRGQGRSRGRPLPARVVKSLAARAPACPHGPRSYHATHLARSSVVTARALPAPVRCQCGTFPTGRLPAAPLPSVGGRRYYLVETADSADGGLWFTIRKKFVRRTVTFQRWF